jgi:hypothetical protein
MQEKRSMNKTLKPVEPPPSRARQASLLQEVSPIPARVAGTDGRPRIVIQGDIRLRVTESFAALRPVKGHYRIETEGMQEPLQVIWIAEAEVLNHTVHSIDVAFDVRGTPAGETLTRLLTVQVTESNGQGSIIHSSIFVQIVVVRDELLSSTPPSSMSGE